MASAGDNLVLSFDDMLDRNRREFEQLGRVGFASGAARKAAQTGLDPTSNIARTLDQRYGSRWRFDVIERQRDDDSMLVVGRLSIPDKKLSVTQAARRRIEPSASTGPIDTGTIAGTADGIAFSLGSASAGRANTAAADTVDAAFRTAAETAAARCLRWFPE